MKLLRYGLGYALMLGAQFAQWLCILLMGVSAFIGVSAATQGQWATFGVASLAVVLWAVGSFVASAAMHLSAHFLP